MRKSWFVWLQTALVCSTLMLTGCENGNLFGKLTDSGESNDPQVLYSQGQDALRDGNYAGALTLFNRLLEIDPDNAKALYGASVAAMGSTGFNLGALISNITTQSALGTSNVTGHDLASVIRSSRISVSAVHTNPNSILNGIDIDALSAVLDDITCYLHRIVSGATDGSIPQDDPNVLINLGLVSIIRAVVDSINNDYFDITNINDAYAVELDTLNFTDADCLNANVSRIAKDVVTSWHLFNAAADKLGYTDDQLIVQLREDIDTAAQELYDAVNNEFGPGNCTTLLTGLGFPNNINDPSGTTVFDPSSVDYCP